MNYGTLGIVGRFKPLHKGHANLLETMCAQSEHVRIGIGSANRYDSRNPWTAEETEGMIRAQLGEGNYSVIHVPDFGHQSENDDGSTWKNYVVKEMGPLDGFVTSNPWTATLLQDSYPLVDALNLAGTETAAFEASRVRLRMAGEHPWEWMVPQRVQDYMKEQGLIERFRQEFGQETLDTKYVFYDNMQLERLRLKEA